MEIIKVIDKIQVNKVIENIKVNDKIKVIETNKVIEKTKKNTTPMDETDKNIIITGINNKYQIKKLKKEPKTIKKRILFENLDIDFSQECQLQSIKDLLNNETETEYLKLMKSQIEHKISNYKNQDLIKNRFNPASHITYNEVVEKLNACNLTCYFCKTALFILYDVVKEKCQWSLDRINNDLGHETNNVLIACLDCNLKKRRKNVDAFAFTKQLIINKI